MRNGIVPALLAAGLFGASTPLAKMLLSHISPWLLVALLYIGSGTGLWIMRRIQGAPKVHIKHPDTFWLAGAILMGGIIGPILLMTGLSAVSASSTALIMNVEGVFTALLAWFAFKEHFDKRIALGMCTIIAGAVVLSWPQHGTDFSVHFSELWPTVALLGACLCWAIDNNLTRKVSLSDASFIAMNKGLVAGATNLVLALITHTTWPGLMPVLGAVSLGFFSYGLGLVFFVVALRHLGTGRTSAYFSTAPFFGTVLAIVLLNEPITVPLLIASTLMAIGVWLHLTEQHNHLHTHEVLEHTHEHVHGTGDEHHDHEHDEPVPAGTRHTHLHRHEPMQHKHPHFPDAHHRHGH